MKSNELFTTVRLPKDISKMDNLEILSHVKVYNTGKNLINLCNALSSTQEDVTPLGWKICEETFLLTVTVSVSASTDQKIIKDQELTPLLLPVDAVGISIDYPFICWCACDCEASRAV